MTEDGSSSKCGCRKLREEAQAFRAAAAAQAEMEVLAERNRQLREEEAKLEKPNPLEVRGCQHKPYNYDCPEGFGIVGLGVCSPKP